MEVVRDGNVNRFRVTKIAAIVVSAIVYFDTLVLSLMAAHSAVFYIVNLGETDHKLPLDNLVGLVDLLWLVCIPIAVVGCFWGRISSFSFITGAVASLIRSMSFLGESGRIPASYDDDSRGYLFIAGLLAFAASVLWGALVYMQGKRDKQISS